MPKIPEPAWKVGDYFHTSADVRVAKLTTGGRRVSNGKPVIGTPPPPVDPTPAISNIVVAPHVDGAQISWHVSEHAEGQVFYGPTAALGSSTKREESLTYQDHIQTIVGVDYSPVYYQIEAEDSAHQVTRTPAHPATFELTVPPVIEPPTDPPPVTLPPGTPVFHGTGGDDTNNLVSFIQANAHKTMAFDGTLKIGNARPTLAAGALSRLVFLPGSLVRPTAAGKAGIQLVRCFDTQVDDYRFEGSQFLWEGVQDPHQTESGFEVYGGDRIVLNDFECYNSRGDGIYTGSDDNLGVPAGAGCKGLTIVRPNMHHNARNGITGNVGTTKVVGPFKIDMSGLMSIDLEPNYDADAATIDFVAADGRMTRHGQFSGVSTFTGWAFAACGKTGLARPRIDLRRISADEFTFGFQNVVDLTLYDLSSDVPVDKSKAVYYAQIQHRDFQRLTNITPYEYAICN